MVKGLRHYWSAWQNFIISNSEPRKILVNLTRDFTSAAKNIGPSPLCRIPANDDKSQIYSIYACSKNIGILNSTHTYLRFVNPNGEVECDIHGVKEATGKKGSAPLAIIVEPKDFEHFTHLSDNDSVLVWQGSAEEAGHKMRLAMALVDRVNESKRPYHLLTQNCNTLLHSLLEVMDLKLPDMPRWAPGLHRILHKDVQEVLKNQHSNHECNDTNWLMQFIGKLESERQNMVKTFGDLSEAALASSSAALHSLKPSAA